MTTTARRGGSREARDKVVGKRRTAREIALQMLYQRDLGGSDLQGIFGAFDAAAYLAAQRDDDGDQGAAPAAPAAPATPTRPEIGERLRRQLAEALGYAQDLVRGTVDHLGEIDGLIRAQAANWRLERMPVVDRNILRLAVYEMLFEEDIPKLVVMDEAIELAKKFGSEQSSRFVNGLLDGLLKRQPFPGSLT
jgi:N utilization substance protein B